MTGLQLLLSLSDISQKYFAEKLDKSPQLINHWLKGRKKIPREQYPKIGEIFKIPREDRQYLDVELTLADKIILEKDYLYNHDQENKYQPVLKNKIADVLVKIEKLLMDDTVYTFMYKHEVKSDKILKILLELIPILDDFDLNQIEALSCLLKILKSEDHSWETNTNDEDVAFGVSNRLKKDLFVILKLNSII